MNLDGLAGTLLAKAYFEPTDSWIGIVTLGERGFLASTVTKIEVSEDEKSLNVYTDNDEIQNLRSKNLTKYEVL